MGLIESQDTDYAERLRAATVLAYVNIGDVAPYVEGLSALEEGGPVRDNVDLVLAAWAYQQARNDGQADSEETE